MSTQEAIDLIARLKVIRARAEAHPITPMIKIGEVIDDLIGDIQDATPLSE